MQFYMMTLLDVLGNIAWVRKDFLSQGEISDIRFQQARITFLPVIAVKLYDVSVQSNQCSSVAAKFDVMLHIFYSVFKVSKGAKIRNRINQVPHLTQDTNGKVANSHLYTTNESQEVSPFPAGGHKAQINSRIQRNNKHKTEKT